LAKANFSKRAAHCGGEDRITDMKDTHSSMSVSTGNVSPVCPSLGQEICSTRGLSSGCVEDCYHPTTQVTAQPLRVPLPPGLVTGLPLRPGLVSGLPPPGISARPSPDTARTSIGSSTNAPSGDFSSESSNSADADIIAELLSLKKRLAEALHKKGDSGSTIAQPPLGGDGCRPSGG
jgi:hypothetical protein